MPISRVRSPKSSSIFPVSGVLLLLAGCSSPKTAALPPAKPGPAVVEAAGRSNPAQSGARVQADPYVAIVRAGTMSGYSQATIGQSFESAFSDVHWTSQQPKNGVRVVRFTGLLPSNMRRDCDAAKAGASAAPCAQDGKVTFEWTFGSDGHLFHLSLADPEPWPETHRSTREMMLFIYG